MDKLLSALDWSLIRAFLVVAERGSLSAAARALGASQPTLGRQIAALESALGAELFTRVPRGLQPTATGAALLPHAQAMRDAAGQIALVAAGQAQRLEGTVRITASVVVAAIQLPPILARIRAAEPLISLELVPSDATTNLLYREADIAVRMYRPGQLDLVTRHLGDMTLGIYAARSYLDRRGVPVVATDLLSHDVIGYDRLSQIEEGFTAMGFPVGRDYFKVRCDDNLAYLALVRAGCGVGFIQDSVAAMDPGLVRLDLGLPLPALPVWLTAHQAMRATPRIRRVWDLLAEGLAPWVTS
jgi:DNA-binding transcriptional LysR family regulator